MKLIDYLGKKVRILSINGFEVIGTVKYYTYPQDNDLEVETIAIETKPDLPLIDFDEPEIKSIEVVQ